MRNFSTRAPSRNLSTRNGKKLNFRLEFLVEICRLGHKMLCSSTRIPSRIRRLGFLVEICRLGFPKKGANEGNKSS